MKRPAAPAWLLAPVRLQRWHLVGMALVVGLLCAAAIVRADMAFQDVRGERADRIVESERALREEIERDRLTRAEVEAIARRIVRLEQPSEAELVRAIRRAIRVCRRRDECRSALREISAPAGRSMTSPPADDPPSPRGRPREPAAPNPRPPSREPDMPTPPAGAPPGPSSPSASSQPPTSAPPESPAPVLPQVEVQVPDTLPLPDVGICTPIVDVDCER